MLIDRDKHTKASIKRWLTLNCKQNYASDKESERNKQTKNENVCVYELHFAFHSLTLLNPYSKMVLQGEDRKSLKWSFSPSLHRTHDTSEIWLYLRFRIQRHIEIFKILSWLKTVEFWLLISSRERIKARVGSAF